MILNLLKGKEEDGKSRLDHLNQTLGSDPNILWYPSAGSDYRDLIELSDERANLHNIEVQPDLFIHTDYMVEGLDHKFTLYDDGKTSVEVENRYELELINEINYEVSSVYAVFNNEAPSKPIIYLLDIKVTSNTFGIIRKPLLYFNFENINFLDQIILKYKLRISHIVKVRDGCGFGGNRKSTSFVYAFLSVMKTKYLLIDTQVDFSISHLKFYVNKYNLDLFSYDLNHCAEIISWSGFKVQVFSTDFKSVPMNNQIFEALLHLIKSMNQKK
jgi:hypothetical protein